MTVSFVEQRSHQDLRTSACCILHSALIRLLQGLSPRTSHPRIRRSHMAEETGGRQGSNASHQNVRCDTTCGISKHKSLCLPAILIEVTIESPRRSKSARLAKRSHESAPKLKSPCTAKQHGPPKMRVLIGSCGH